MSRHSTLPGILAMSPALEEQIRAFTSWQQQPLKLPEDLLNILDLIKEQGSAFNSALMSLQSVHDRLSNDRDHRGFDEVIVDLENRFAVNFSKEVANAKDVFLELNKAASELSPASSRSSRASGKASRSRQEEARVTFGNFHAQLKPHLADIEMVARRLRLASRTESDAFAKEYDALERIHSREVSMRLRRCFKQAPFAVTVSLDLERGQSEEEGRDDADMIYEYLNKEKGLETFLGQFNDMGSKWAAAKLRSPPEMQTLEMAYTKLSCGVLDALQQSVPRDEEKCRIWEDTDTVHYRLAKWEKLTSDQKIIIAIGGQFSHGKSSFLNALMGEEVLPTNKKFTTAIPCRIQHKAGAKLTLEIPQLKPYKDLLTRLTDYALDGEVNGIPDVTLAEEAAKFVERCKEARFFENDSASSQATSLVFTERRAVIEQLDAINNLVRLCSKLRDSKPLEVDSPLVWPIITYDIAILGLSNLTANVQFLDLPGFNDEVSSITEESAPFFSMMKHAAEEATIIIPVVSWKTVANEFGPTWDHLEKILGQQKWKNRIPTVVVTNAPRENHTKERYETVQCTIASLVWKTIKRSDRVLFCDSLIGLGAMQLERLFQKCLNVQDQKSTGWRSEDSLNLAENILNPSSPMHHLQIITATGFSRYERNTWSTFLGAALYCGGIAHFNTFLSSKICTQSPRRRLEAFHQIFPAAFQNLIFMHKQAIDDLRMPTEDLNRIASVNDDTKQVEEGLKVWKTKTDDIINKLAELTDGFVNDFKTSVKGEWEVVKEKLEKSLLGASSQDRLRKFPSRMEYRLHVDPYIRNLARSFVAIQAQHVNNILDIVSQGSQEFMDAITDLTDATITDASWKVIVATSLKELKTEKSNVLVHRLKAKIEGTTTDKYYTATDLLKSLDSWAPLTDEHFDHTLGHAPSTRNPTYRDSITSPVIPAPALLNVFQPSETDLEAPTPEASTSDHTPDEPQYTTKELAKDEIKDSGFHWWEPSPDDWLNDLPVDSALVAPRHRGIGYKTQEVTVIIDQLLNMIEVKFVNHYVETMVKKTPETSCGWLKKIAEACQQRFKQLMLDRKEELDQQIGERNRGGGTHVTRIVRHLMAMANLTAANAAIKKLQDAVVEWDSRSQMAEDADITVDSLNSPRPSSIIH